MENILIRVGGVDLPTPSSYKINYEDLDVDTYRSVVNGNLVRSRLKPRWVKLELSYRWVDDAMMNTIARLINTDAEIDVECKSPAFGNMGVNNTWARFKAYCSNFNAEMIEAQVGWTLSFNIIQSTGADFQ